MCLYWVLGQVSLPVLSRKGKYDNWNYNWVSFKNYSSLINEDLFIKRFLFLFFMYGLTPNKIFLQMFFKKTRLKAKQKDQTAYNLHDFTFINILTLISSRPRAKFYISQLFLCRYKTWIYIYIYIYSISNRNLQFKKNKNKINKFNKYLFYQTYLISKHKYLTNLFIKYN